EIDGTADSSPRSVQASAQIPNLYGSGVSALMTYYVTAAGATVFALGAFFTACSSRSPGVDTLIATLLQPLGVEWLAVFTSSRSTRGSTSPPRTAHRSTPWSAASRTTSVARR